MRLVQGRGGAGGCRGLQARGAATSFGGPSPILGLALVLYNKTQ